MDRTPPADYDERERLIWNLGFNAGTDAATAKLEQIKREAKAIADALGARGLIDFADDVRMLIKL